MGCSANKFTLIPATGSGVNNGVITVTVGSPIAGMYYSDVSDLVENLIPSSGIDSYTYTMMVFPEGVDLDASGRGQMPGTFTWYDNDYAEYATLGVHEIGKIIHNV